jgi:hypothetical protein
LWVFAKFFYLRNEAVATTRQGLNEAGAFRRVAEGFAKAGDGAVQAMIEIDEGVGRPNPLPQLFLGHYLAGVFDEDCENLERLFLQLDPDSPLAQFAGLEVQFKNPELDEIGLGRGCGHAAPPSIQRRAIV